MGFVTFGLWPGRIQQSTEYPAACAITQKEKKGAVFARLTLSRTSHQNTAPSTTRLGHTRRRTCRQCLASVRFTLQGSKIVLGKIYPMKDVKAFKKKFHCRGRDGVECRRQIYHSKSYGGRTGQGYFPAGYELMCLRHGRSLGKASTVCYALHYDLACFLKVSPCAVTALRILF